MRSPPLLLTFLVAMASTSVAQAQGKPIDPKDEKQVGSCIAKLKSDDQITRMEAVMAAMTLGKSAPQALVREIAALSLREKDPELRSMVFSALSTYEPKQIQAVAPTLLSALDRKDVREHVAFTLARLGPKTPKKVISVLVELLKSPNGGRRMAAAGALGETRSTDPGVIAALIKLLEATKHGWGPQSAAASALGEIGPAAKAAVPALLKVIAQKPPRPGRHGIGAFLTGPGSAALMALVSIQPDHEQVLPSIRKCLKRKDRRSQRVAAACLRRLGPKGASLLPLLLEQLKGTDMLRNRSMALVVGDMGEAAKPAIPVLIDLIKRTLGPAQKGLYRDRAACEGAIEALGNLGPMSKAAVPALEEVIAQDKRLGKTAKTALAKIKR